MPELVGPLADIRDFLEAGGAVVYMLLVVATVMWALIIERSLYYWKEMPRLLASKQEIWDARPEHASWHSRKIKRLLVSEASNALRGSLPLIKAFVALCPLIGLLGTVTGMIQVFQVMASVGTGNARAMAGGVSAATIPTMAGMVLALSGLYPISRFEHIVSRESRKLSDHMITH